MEAGRCFRHQLLLPRPYLVLIKPLRLDIRCFRHQVLLRRDRHVYDGSCGRPSQAHF